MGTRSPAVVALSVMVYSLERTLSIHSECEGDLWFNPLNNQLYVFTLGAGFPTSSAVAGVNSVSGLDPIEILNTPNDPTISVKVATTTQTGVSRHANQGEVDAAVADDVVLTPVRLKNGIDGYLPQATEERKGVMEIATVSETLAGADTLKAVTPARTQLSLVVTLLEL